MKLELKGDFFGKEFRRDPNQMTNHQGVTFGGAGGTAAPILQRLCFSGDPVVQRYREVTGKGSLYGLDRGRGGARRPREDGGATWHRGGCSSRPDRMLGTHYPRRDARQITRFRARGQVSAHLEVADFALLPLVFAKGKGCSCVWWGGMGEGRAWAGAGESQEYHENPGLRNPNATPALRHVLDTTRRD